MADIYVGVDVSKDWIDIFHPKHGASRLRQAPETLAKWAQEIENSHLLVVFEATGSYDTPLREALEEAGISYHRANPARARDFARAVGIIGKTDRVDARCLERMGRQLGLVPTALLSAAQSALKKLAARRRQLVEMRKQEKTRLKQFCDPEITEGVTRMIEYLDEEIQEIEARMKTLTRADSMKKNAEIIQSMPGVGPVVAATLLAELPELGQADRRAIAALAGLAPIANDSGQRAGQRRIGKGRNVVRSSLYIAALHASRHSRHFKGIRNKLESKGKSAKQAIIAVARKMLTMLNAMIKSHQTYREPNAEII